MDDNKKIPENQVDFIEAEIVGGAHHGQQFQCPKDQTVVRFYDGAVPHDYYKLNSVPRFYSTDHPFIQGWNRGRK